MAAGGVLVHCQLEHPLSGVLGRPSLLAQRPREGWTVKPKDGHYSFVTIVIIIRYCYDHNNRKLSDNDDYYYYNHHHSYYHH